MNLKTPGSSSLAAAGSTGKANSPESSSASADSASKGKVMSFVLSPEFSGAGVAMPSSKFNSARSMLAIGESESTAATSSPSLSGSCNVRSSGCESASFGVAVDSSAPKKPSPAISSESDVATGGMSAAGVSSENVDSADASSANASATISSAAASSAGATASDGGASSIESSESTSPSGCSPPSSASVAAESVK